MKTLIPLLFLGLLFTACEDEPQAPTRVFVSIEDFTHEYAPGSSKELPLLVSTVGPQSWEGTVELMLQQNDSTLQQWEKAFRVAADSSQLQHLEIRLPQQEGTYHLVAKILNLQSEPILSRRLIEVKEAVRLKIGE